MHNYTVANVLAYDWLGYTKGMEHEIETEKSRTGEIMIGGKWRNERYMVQKRVVQAKRERLVAVKARYYAQYILDGVSSRLPRYSE